MFEAAIGMARDSLAHSVFSLGGSRRPKGIDFSWSKRLFRAISTDRDWQQPAISGPTMLNETRGYSLHSPLKNLLMDLINKQHISLWNRSSVTHQLMQIVSGCILGTPAMPTFL